MQDEILAANPGSRIRILVVNGAGYEGNVPAFAEGTSLPLLQDTAEGDVWGAWGIGFHDVVVLDGSGRARGVFNLADHNLSYKPEYEVLLRYLRLSADE